MGIDELDEVAAWGFWLWTVHLWLERSDRPCWWRWGTLTRRTRVEWSRQ